MLPISTHHDDEQRQIAASNLKHREMKHNTLVHELISERSIRSPESIAIEFEDRKLRYGELEARANRLSRALRAARVGPESIVVLTGEPAIETVIAILAILKAGGAYLPIDSATPRERIDLMLGECSATAIVTTDETAPSWNQEAASIIMLDQGLPAFAKFDDTPLPSIAQPTNLAYVIYTSGSTGRPKGVMLEHRGLCDMAIEHVRLFGIQPESRVLQFASLSFDACVSEIFMTLVGGATLIIAPRRRLSPGPDLVQTLKEFEITNVLLPPSVLAVLPDTEFPKLATLIAGGERCPREIANRWFADRHFFNAYGPTESTVTATTMRIHSESTVDPPIGMPRTNVQAYVLDDDLNPVPAGVDGELYLTGSGLARGYLNSPDLTAEKFLPNPFCDVPGTRLYRTGDVARQRDDGAIEFVGRKDRQVKLRGFRIELDEIEICLRRHDRISNTAILLSGQELTDKRLVAFVETVDQKPIADEMLRRWLKNHLPDYMIPSSFSRVPSLPLTINGKLDYAKLSAQLAAHDNDGDVSQPNTETEKKLLDLWQTVFGAENIGINDHFVELGGDSLTCALLTQRAVAIGIRLDAQQLFDFPTIAKLAAEIIRLEK